MRHISLLLALAVYHQALAEQKAEFSPAEVLFNKGVVYGRTGSTITASSWLLALLKANAIEEKDREKVWLFLDTSISSIDLSIPDEKEIPSIVIFEKISRPSRDDFFRSFFNYRDSVKWQSPDAELEKSVMKFRERLKDVLENSNLKTKASAP